MFVLRKCQATLYDNNNSNSSSSGGNHHFLQDYSSMNRYIKKVPGADKHNFIIDTYFTFWSILIVPEIRKISQMKCYVLSLSFSPSFFFFFKKLISFKDVWNTFLNPRIITILKLYEMASVYQNQKNSIS